MAPALRLEPFRSEVREPIVEVHDAITLMLLVSLAAVALAFVGLRTLSRRQGLGTPEAGRALTRFELTS